MINTNQLLEMSKMDIAQINTEALVDVGSVKIDSSLSAPRRMESYLEQVKNPYCFLCENRPVRISFAADGKPLAEKLLDYFVGLKNR